MTKQNSNDIYRMLDNYKYRKDEKSLKELKSYLINYLRSMYDLSNEDKANEIERTSQKDFQLLIEGLKTEVWKNLSKDDCLEFEGFEDYQISSFGRIRNKDGKILSPFTIGGKDKFQRLPYQAIRIFSNGKRKTFYIHRLVGYSFLNFEYRYLKRNGVSKIEINHKDKNPRNNHISNLEWCSSMYNRKHEKGVLNDDVSFFRYYNLQKYICSILFDCLNGKLPLDLIKGDRIEFPSILSMSDLLDLNVETINVNNLSLDLPIDTDLRL